MTKKLSTSSLLLTQEELQKHILGMTLFNDLLARAVLEDKEACEHILRILTGIKTLVIKKNKTQYVISKLFSHNIIMDVLAEDATTSFMKLKFRRQMAALHTKRGCFITHQLSSMNTFLRVTRLMHLYPSCTFFISARQISGSSAKPATQS